ncbi:MAG: hypothetical protein KBA66_05375 [Leptospiraceae bacterium]|nr:hypothetical protein [Leptospiraceae bacterium]
MIAPFIQQKISEIEYPPTVGQVFEYIVNESDRIANFTVGANTGDIPTKCSAISEHHLTFTFKKDPRAEEYTITIKREGPVLYKHPRMTHFLKMASTEKLESHEMIGKLTEFRLSDKISKDRMIDFIEITVSTAFVFSKSGRERLKFIFTFSKVHPGFNLKVKNRNGLFPLGKDGHHREEVVVEEDN